MAFPTQSADFEASSSQYLTRADNALLEGGTAFTVEGWIKPESYGSKLWSKRNVSPNRSYSIGLGGTSSSDSYIFAQLSSDGSSNAYDSSKLVPITLGTWYHIAFTFSGSGLANEIKYFLNGVQQGTTDAPGFASVFDNTSDFAIGCENPNGTPVDFYDGRMVLVRMWQVVRTEAEIAANMCTVLGTTASLSGEWTLDNTLNDNSGNSLTLTDHATVTFGADVPAACAAAGDSGRDARFFTLRGVG